MKRLFCLVVCVIVVVWGLSAGVSLANISNDENFTPVENLLPKYPFLKRQAQDILEKAVDKKLQTVGGIDSTRTEILSVEVRAIPKEGTEWEPEGARIAVHATVYPNGGKHVATGYEVYGYFQMDLIINEKMYVPGFPLDRGLYFLPVVSDDPWVLKYREQCFNVVSNFHECSVSGRKHCLVPDEYCRLISDAINVAE